MLSFNDVNFQLFFKQFLKFFFCRLMMSDQRPDTDRVGLRLHQLNFLLKSI